MSQKRRFLFTEAAIVLTACILFGTLCLRLFKQSDKAVRFSTQRAAAVEMGETLIKVFKQHQTLEGFLSDDALIPFGLEQHPDITVMLYAVFDEDWSPVAAEAAVYGIRLMLRPDPSLGEMLYGLDVEVYICGTESVTLALLHAAQYYVDSAS